jgi:hypothetical protein
MGWDDRRTDLDIFPLARLDNPVDTLTGSYSGITFGLQVLRALKALAGKKNAANHRQKFHDDFHNGA